MFNRRPIDPMKFAIQIPFFAAICIFNRRATDPMKFAVQIPYFAVICIFNRRPTDPMKIAVQIPIFGAVGVSFANGIARHYKISNSSCTNAEFSLVQDSRVQSE